MGKTIGTSGDIIGRYERNIMTPSIDVIVKIAHTLGVSIDYLAVKTNIEPDRNTLKRLEDIATLSDENKSFIFRMIDMALRDLKTGQAYATKYKIKTMNLQYITDTKGHKSAVQLPLKDWEQIQKDLGELKRLRNKKLFMTELAEAIEEMKLIKEGKKHARNAEDFLNEL